MLVLCFDFGLKYIGIAIGQTVTKTSFPLTSIFIKKNWCSIYNFIDHWEPKFIVIGYPFFNINLNNQLLLKFNLFIMDIKSYFTDSIFIIDEYLSTWETKKFFPKNFLFKNRYFYINAVSAAILLERWLNSR